MYQNLQGITKTLTVMLYGYIVFRVLLIPLNIFAYVFISRVASGYYVDPEVLISTGQTIEQIANIAMIILILFSVIVFITTLRWTYRAHKNAQAITATPMETKANWAVIWYFIPIAHLFKPYQYTKEI